MEDLSHLLGRDPEDLTDEQLLSLLNAELHGSASPGDLPFEVQVDRDRAIDSPSFLATDILDHWYKQHFERRHYVLLDEVMGPYIRGETVRIDGVNYDPHDYRGILILWSRGTIKSTCCRIIALWEALWQRIRNGRDSRTAFIHQVLAKAIGHGMALKEIARQNHAFRKHFPEFAPPAAQKEWDTKQEWRWPCFTDYQANEFSFTAYGETSNKIGGHYSLRVTDDWVTQDSVGTTDALAKSEFNFKAIDNLRDRTLPWNPWLVVGTHYHYQDVYKKLEKQGNWLVWKVPGFEGSPKVIFDLVALDRSTKAGRLRVKRGIEELERDHQDKLNFPKILPWRELYDSAVAQQGQGTELGANYQEFNCQIMLQPVPEGEQRFDHVAVDEMWTDTIPGPGQLYIHCRIDPAIGAKRQNDEVVINISGRCWQNHVWYVDGWHGRERRPTVVLRQAFSMMRKWQRMGYDVKNLGIEAVAFQEAMAQSAREGIPERDPQFAGERVKILRSPCSVISITRSSDMRKDDRILMLEGPVTRRECHIWTRNPIGRRIASDHKEFPHGPKDILDTCHDSFLHARRPPRAASPEMVGVHPVFERYLQGLMLGSEVGGPKETGMSNTVKLAGWRG